MKTALIRNMAIAALTAPALFLAACGGGDGAGSDGPMAKNQRADDIIMGEADAPVLVIEYASITCGHCKSFHDNTLDAFKEKYVDTGLVKYTFREFPTPPAPIAMAGFLVARCAPEDEYYDVLDTLFERQLPIVQSQNPREELLKVAQAAGLSEDKFDACIRDDANIERINDVVDDGVETYNINSTPTFIIDGQAYTGARPLSFFDEKLAPLLGDRAPALEAETSEDAGETAPDEG